MLIYELFRMKNKRLPIWVWLAYLNLMEMLFSNENWKNSQQLQLQNYTTLLAFDD